MTMRIRTGARACLALAAVCSAAPAVAESITLFAEGALSGVLPSQIAGAFPLGATFTAIWTFESTTPDTNASPGWGNYSGAMTAASFTTDGYNASCTSGAIRVYNDNVGDDRYVADGIVCSGPSIEGAFFYNGSVVLIDATGTAFDSDALPTDLDLSSFTSGSINLYLSEGDQGFSISVKH
jgi:hypothetical protein